MRAGKPPHHMGARQGYKFTPEQRNFIGRVISRLTARPAYMKLNACAAVWDISDNWAMTMRNEARGI